MPPPQSKAAPSPHPRYANVYIRTALLKVTYIAIESIVEDGTTTSEVVVGVPDTGVDDVDVDVGSVVCVMSKDVTLNLVKENSPKTILLLCN